MNHLLIKKIDEISNFMANQSLVNKDVMNVKEASLFMNVSTSYLHKLTSKGEIPFSKPRNKLIFFKREELENWMLRKPITKKLKPIEPPQPRKLKA